MGNVVVDMSISLDWIAARPNRNEGDRMSAGGEQLHAWFPSDDPARDTTTGAPTEREADARMVRERFAATGSVVEGNRTFDLGFESWGGTPFPTPGFVDTHEAREELVTATGTFAFVTEGIESAVVRARAAAGDKDVIVMGDPGIAQQAVRAGLVDEISIPVAPVLLGAGSRLSENLAPRPVELERIESVATPTATHLRFRVVTRQRVRW